MAGEEGAGKAAAAAAALENACLVGDDGSSDAADAACARSTTVAAGPSDTFELEPEPAPAAGGPAVGWGGAAGVDAEGLLGNTVLLSVSGGLKDLMVHPSLCVADGLGLEGQSVSFTTEVMEDCGFQVDHKALAWCKQVVGRYGGWVCASKVTSSVTSSVDRPIDFLYLLDVRVPCVLRAVRCPATDGVELQCAGTPCRSTA